MRLFALCLLVLIAFSPTALAYPNDQLKECILSTKQSPIVLGVPQSSIEQYCDCALKLIVDEGKEGQSSANQCASKSFS